MAEQLVNEFTVNRPIDEAWAVITDVERIAPCLPGAQLQEIEGDIYRGVVKVKLGSITPQFKGQATFIERDDAAHRAVLKAEGRDTGGRGNAAAEITAQAESLSPTSTRCVVTTDLHITGKVAQFGRGIIGDVSKKLMAQFASNLNTMLDEQGAGSPAAGNGDRADTRRPPTPTPAAAEPDAGGGHRRHRRPRHRPGPTSPDRSPGCARSTARPPSRSTSPASPARRSSSAWRRSSSAARPAAHPAPPPPLGPAASADARRHDRGRRRRRVAELLGRRPAGRFEVVVRDDAGEPGGDPQRPVARRRHADADALLARRPRPRSSAVSRLEAAGGVARRRGGGRRRRARRRPRPLRRRARRRRSPPTPTPRRPAASAAPAQGVKCLHAHYAWHLAGGDDPVGRWVAAQLSHDARRRRRRDDRPCSSRRGVGPRSRRRSATLLARARRPRPADAAVS